MSESRPHFAFPRLPFVTLICFLLIISLYGSIAEDGEEENWKPDRHYAKSIVELENLELLELQFVKNVSDKLGKLPQNSNLRPWLESYLREFYNGSGLLHDQNIHLLNETRSSKNPICGYKLLKRVTRTLKHLIENPDFSSSLGILGDAQVTLKKYFENDTWPKETHVEESIRAIIRLQTTYNLSAAEFANGLISGIQTNCILNSADAYEIALNTNKTKYFVPAIEFLDIALEKALEDHKVDQELITRHLRDIIDIHNKEFEHMETFKGSFGSQSFFERKISSAPGDYKVAKKLKEFRYDLCRGKRDSMYSECNFAGLCAGDILQSDVEISFLFCWLEFKKHPYFTIGPIKMEFLARNPDVVQMYDVILDNEIQELQSQARSSMYLSVTIDTSRRAKEKEREADDVYSQDFRTSTNAWLWNLTLSNHMAGKIERYTGLEVVRWGSSEPFQIAAYSFVGQFGPHIDSLNKMNRGITNDRLATFMFYLNDVELGGTTAFTSVGAAAKPIKGSAVYWYDLNSNGLLEKESYHGACPVLLGEKWIANKWILHDDQMSTRKCSLKPKEKFRFAVNGQYLPIPVIKNQVTKPASAKDKPATMYSHDIRSQLISLVVLEWKLYKIFKASYEDHKVKVQDGSAVENKEWTTTVEKYLKDVENSTVALIENVYKNVTSNDEITDEQALVVVTDLLGSLKTLTRFGQIQSFIKRAPYPDSELMTEIIPKITKIYEYKSQGPQSEDYRKSVLTLLNIQYVNNMKPEQISQSLVGDRKLALPALDCYLIGNFALSLKFFAIGIPWMQYGLHLVQNKNDTTLKAKRIIDSMGYVEDSHDVEFSQTTGYAANVFERKITNTLDMRPRKALFYDKLIGNPDPAYADINFWRTCELGPYQTETERSKLFCWYEHEIHPSFKISPIKTEILSMRPKLEVVQYYDIISERIIQELKTYALENNIYDGSIVKPTTGISTNELRDPSVQAVIQEKKFDASRSVSKIVERITGLKVLKTKREALEVSAFLPGSYTPPRNDANSNTKSNAGRRLATFMIYMSDAPQNGGGERVFTQAGIKITPKKGSALFWFNTLSSGDESHIAWHADCPVMMGEQWVANKWISFEKQQHLQCHVDRSATQEILKNGRSKYLKS